MRLTVKGTEGSIEDDSNDGSVLPSPKKPYIIPTMQTDINIKNEYASPRLWFIRGHIKITANEQSQLNAVQTPVALDRTLNGKYSGTINQGIGPIPIPNENSYIKTAIRGIIEAHPYIEFRE